jgi:hypothetical protein
VTFVRYDTLYRSNKMVDRVIFEIPSDWSKEISSGLVERIIRRNKSWLFLYHLGRRTIGVDPFLFSDFDLFIMIEPCH